MFPIGAGPVTLHDIVIKAMEFFQHTEVVPQEENLVETCMILLQHDTTIERDDEASKMQSTYVLFHACIDAKELNFIEELWVEITSYASTYCSVDMHAHQLRKFLEFVSCLAPSSSSWFVGSIPNNTALYWYVGLGCYVKLPI
ncbi:hypothetical protein CR513_11743, partial [Mucuna pruriens]